MRNVNNIVGRFAPSPTGPLHFGSLVAALASFLDTRANQGTWLLRIEDLDPPRESESAPAKIMKQLHSFGMDWDAPPMFQSTRLDAYSEALARLSEAGHTFLCTCTRKATRGVYPGTCRDKQHTDQASAIRVLTTATSIHFDDQILGPRAYNMEQEIGDFIIKRKDGLFAYQLAVVVDDHFQQVDRIIRGNDLLDSTPRQIFLNRCLNYPSPSFAHFPVVLGDDGQKLSKQAHAAPVTSEDSATVLATALKALGQRPVDRNPIGKMLDQAIRQWALDQIPRQLTIPNRDL